MLPDLQIVSDQRKVITSIALAVVLFCVPLFVAVALVAVFVVYGSGTLGTHIPQLVALLTAGLFAALPHRLCVLCTPSRLRDSRPN